MKPQKKYGLIKMQGIALGSGKKKVQKPASVVAKKAAPSTAFQRDDDDDEAEMRGLRQGGKIDVHSINRSIAAQQQSSSRLVEKLKEDALAEDPTLFEYDSLYDSMQGERADKKEQRKKDFDPSSGREKKEARYIQQLKKSADIRKVDEERIFQMKLKKEADAEAHIYGEKERFVTAAYKEKLTEMGRWKAEDERLKALEEATTVDNKKSMVDFYSNLLTKNLAMGSGDVTKDATSAYTIGSKRNEHIRELEAKQRGDDGASADEKDARSGVDKDDVDEDALLQKTEESDRKRLRLDTSDGGRPPVEDKTEVIAGSPEPKATPNQVASEREVQKEGKSSEPVADEAQAAAEAKSKREESILSARERYLQRKKAKAN